MIKLFGKEVEILKQKLAFSASYKCFRFVIQTGQKKVDPTSYQKKPEVVLAKHALNILTWANPLMNL